MVVVELVVVVLVVVVEDVVVELVVVELVVVELVVVLVVVEDVVVLVVVVGDGVVVVVVGCGVGPIHVTCPKALIVKYDPTVSGGPLFVKLSVVTFEPDRLLITVELPLLATSTPMPAMPHVQGRLAKGLLPGSKSPCGVPIIG